MSRAEAADLRERAQAHQRTLSAEIRAAVEAHLAMPLSEDLVVTDRPEGGDSVFHNIACPPALLEALYATADRAGRSAMGEVRIAIRRHMGSATPTAAQPQLITR